MVHEPRVSPPLAPRLFLPAFLACASMIAGTALARQASVSAKSVSHASIAVDENFSTSKETVIEIAHGEADGSKRRAFKVLVGPLCQGSLCPDSNAPAAKGILRNADPEWEAQAGYALVRGWRPRTRTHRTTAAAEGTTYFVQTVGEPGQSGTIYRYVLIEGGPLFLYHVGTDEGGSVDVSGLKPVCEMTEPMTYVEVKVGSPGEDDSVWSVPVRLLAGRTTPLNDDEKTLLKLVQHVRSSPLAQGM